MREEWEFYRNIPAFLAIQHGAPPTPQLRHLEVKRHLYFQQCVVHKIGHRIKEQLINEKMHRYKAPTPSIKLSLLVCSFSRRLLLVKLTEQFIGIIHAYFQPCMEVL